MTTSSTASDLSSGSALGRYELLLPIAKGGMAQVWAARLHGTRGFQKVVAIKTIISGAIDDARMEEMFLVEAELASQIHHPNVVGTIDLGEHNGILYLVMEWVDGESLNQVMSRGATKGGVPLAIGVNLIGQACKGLYAAHNSRDDQGNLLGVVHRDVSPQNLLVTFSGTAKLVDFGIAKATSKGSGFTEAGEVKGKFAYMAPEQVRAQPVDNRTDLFALGILLYQITTGKHPFRGEHPAETLQNICAEHGPTPPSALHDDYPPELEAVVLKALAKNPDQRFACANDLLTALERAMPGPLEASFDVQVAEYLKELFGTRAAEKRIALRVAQERIDQQRAESSSSISLGTLRAIAIDQNDTPSIASLRVTRSSRPSLPGSSPPTLAVLPGGRSSRPLVALAGALVVVGGGLLVQLSRQPNSPQALAATGVVSGALQPPRAAAQPTPVVTTPTEPAPVELPSEASERSGDSKKKSLLRDRKLPHVARPLSSSTPATTAVPSVPALTSPVVPTVEATTQPNNTFGRGAFGGRH